MDQLRPLFAFLNKNGFWLSCGLVALLSLGGWYYAVSGLAEEANKNRGEIKTLVNQLNSTARKKAHPNKTTNDKMDEIRTAFAVNVRDGWEKVYARQRDVLVWPDTFDAKFRRAVDPLRPIEVVPYPTVPDKEIFTDLRRQYRDWIQNELPSLAKMVGTEWVARGKAGSGGGPAPVEYARPPVLSGEEGGVAPKVGPDGRPIIVDNSIVKWNPQNQQEIRDTHFGFADHNEPPTTLEVLYAQETLWVLQALTQIVHDLNKGAQARHEAALKDIDYIRVGQSAGGVAGQVRPVQANAVTSAAGPGSNNPYETGRMPPTMPTTGGRPGEGGPGGPLQPGAKVDPAEGRYVDQNYLPLPALRLRKAVTGTPEKEEDVVLAVAKRIPVRMRVRIDQRRVNQLLAICGNSALPLEVRQVRINRDSVAAGNSQAGGGGYGQFNSGHEMRGGEPGRPSGPGASLHQPDSNEITLEVFGIVYIYNPANTTLLNLNNPAGPVAIVPGGGNQLPLAALGGKGSGPN